MRTTLTLDDDVYEAASYVATASGRRLGKVLSELARRGLEAGSVPIAKGKRRFPVFEVPPGTPILPASRVQKVIDEEGIF